MQATAGNRRDGPVASGGGAGIRPLLLATGLGLMWFAVNHEGSVGGDAPVWGVGLIIAARLLTDIVGAWGVVSVAHLVLALGRLGLAHWRAHRWVA